MQKGRQEKRRRNLGAADDPQRAPAERPTIQTPKFHKQTKSAYRHGMLLVEFLLDKLEEEGGFADIRVPNHDEFEDQRCDLGRRFDVRGKSNSTCALATLPSPPYHLHGMM